MRRPDPTAVTPSRRAVVAYVLVVATIAGVATVDGHQQATLDVELEVAGVACVQTADGAGGGDAAWNVSELTVVATNHGSTTVEPVFRVPHQHWHIQNAWDVREGPGVLSPGERATYRLAAPGPPAYIYNQSVGVVFLDDQTSERRAATDAVWFACPPGANQHERTTVRRRWLAPTGGGGGAS